MYISIEDAVVIYARVCRTRYGRRARRIVIEHAQALWTSGDESGAQVWQQVAVEIERLEAEGVARFSPKRRGRSS
jgi:hypothetical protein